jgi:hypothetical protein
MRMRLAIPVSLMICVSACEQPTAPELAAKMEQAQHEILSDSAGQHWLENMLAGDWLFTKLLPDSDLQPNFVSSLDGRDHLFKAFVFERIVIPRVGYQDHPCLRASKTLVGLEDRSQVFMLRGHDFGEPLGNKAFCTWISPQNKDNYAAAPVLWLARLGNKPGLVGTSGTASIADLGASGKCDFLKIESNPAYRIDCELRRYVVTMNVQLDVVHDKAQSIIGHTGDMISAPQTVTGLRLTIHCTEATEASFGGCESPSS